MVSVAYPVHAALSQVADRHCLAEVEAYQRCKAGSLGSDCEPEDLAALACASRAVHYMPLKHVYAA